ncbi:MAG: SIMPL domain-containing protein [Methanoregula sp.]|nr:SIMPL domain-containing protein [Methanoregula sp.]
MIKRQSLFIIALAIMAIACVGIAAAGPLDTGNDNVIHASGTGNVIGTPDRAQVTFSVRTENPDVKIAQQDNAVRMANVINALVAIGIPRDALKTTGYNIYPMYEDYSKSVIDQKIRTYQVTNTLTVTLHDVNRTGDVIDVAVANGINQASSIQFLLSDEQSQVLRTEALKKAVSRARADADTVAGALGTSIIGVQSADISGGYSPVLFENYQYAGGDAMMKSATPTPIQPGDITVSAQVSITYLIR